ncbi:DUF4384 domain-containing protein [Treponema primitia]|uniref:C1 family peptidase n=1 Tax=Treponema primitia TaxID=88058 RepID=UPI003980DD6D
MKNKTGIKVWAFTLIFLLFSAFQVFPQEFALGAILDSETYNRLPQKAVLSTRAYNALPPTVSLKQYSPIPGNQTPYGTCVAWASAYAARTISESIAINRRERSLSTDNVFSPAYIYMNITDDPDCQSGAMIFWALDLMKNTGAVKMLESERDLDFRKINRDSFTESRKYPIADYVTLFRNDEERGSNRPSRIQMVKKSLAEKKPVIIGMNTPESFLNAQDVWRPRENPGYHYGGHAMCVVGYDDTRFGGAFEVQNSWGKKWGNGGYMWIPYEAFGQWVMEAYEIIENFAVFDETNQYSGFAQIELADSADGLPHQMPVAFAEEGYYRTTESYSSGTEFRFHLGNTSPAYVYVFAADSSGSPSTQIFPPRERGISPILDYAENTIVLPGEREWIRMDEITGTDYLIILYSKQSIPIETIRRRFDQAQGSFPQRVAAAVGPDFIPSNNASYDGHEIRFDVKSENSKAVFGLLLAIDHK